MSLTRAQAIARQQIATQKQRDLARILSTIYASDPAKYGAELTTSEKLSLYGLRGRARAEAKEHILSSKRKRAHVWRKSIP